MQEQEVERVIPLLDAKLNRYDNLLQRYRSAFGKENILHVPIPERTYIEPDVLQDEVLPFLDQAVAQDEITVIHCSAGVGRTGHLLVAWLVHGRDMDFARALDTVSQSSQWAAGDVYRNPTEAGDRETLEQIITEATE
jgi:protein-tyrosine phosphatase